MTHFKAGDKGQGLCHNDGRVSTTFEVRDVPFRDGSGVVPGILVASCDACREVIGIPAQATPAIAAARKKIEAAAK